MDVELYKSLELKYFITATANTLPPTAGTLSPGSVTTTPQCTHFGFCLCGALSWNIFILITYYSPRLKTAPMSSLLTEPFTALVKGLVFLLAEKNEFPTFP